MSVTLESGGAAAVTIADGTAAVAVANCYYTPFLQRLYVLSAVVATAVLMEDPATTNHSSRASYARQLLFDPATLVNRQVAFVVVGDGATGAGSTDNDICNRLGDCWNILSYGY